MQERFLTFFTEFGEYFNLSPQNEVEGVERALIYISLLTEFDKEEITVEDIIDRLSELAEEAIQTTAVEVEQEEQDEE